MTVHRDCEATLHIHPPACEGTRMRLPQPLLQSSVIGCAELSAETHVRCFQRQSLVSLVAIFTCPKHHLSRGNTTRMTLLAWYKVAVWSAAAGV